MMKVKLINSKVLAGLMTMGLLAGCTDDPNVNKNKPGKESSSEEVTAEPVEDVSIGSSASGNSAAVIDYATLIGTYSQSLSQSMMDMSELTSEVSADPMVLQDSEWMMEMAVTLSVMEQTMENMRAVTPPSEMAEIHGTVLKALDEYQFVVDNLPTAIDTLDVDLMNQCSEAVMAGTEYVTEATALMEEYKEERF